MAKRRCFNFVYCSFSFALKRIVILEFGQKSFNVRDMNQNLDFGSDCVQWAISFAPKRIIIRKLGQKNRSMCVIWLKIHVWRHRFPALSLRKHPRQRVRKSFCIPLREALQELSFYQCKEQQVHRLLYMHL